MQTLTEQIRERLKALKPSHRKVHLATGLTRATVKRFLEGGAVGCDTLDILAQYVGAAITLPPLPKEAKPKR